MVSRSRPGISHARRGIDPGPPAGDPSTTPELPVSLAMLPRARLNLPALARAWVVYLVLGCLVVAAYFTILAPSLQGPVYNLLGISSVGATALGIWRWRPARQRAWILLAVGVALGYAKMSLDGTYAVGQLVDAGWLLGYVALGVAALHPSMALPRAEPAAQDARRTTLTLPRLLLLAGAGMSGPAVVALETMRGDAPDAFAVAVGLSVVYLLVLWRAVLGLKSLEGSMRERGRLTVELAEQANHDPLTGLANRRLFLARLDAALAHPEPDRMVAMLYLDLDRIKAINDSKGHAAGDAAIATVSERLRVGLRSADTVARLGGDEFGILLTATTREAARGM